MDANADYSLEVVEINRKLTEIPTKFINTSQMEAYCGVIQFISCLYVLPVVPYQMKRVGYDETGSIIATTVCCAIGSIIAAFLTDMPFIVAPPTSVSIFLAVSMQQQGLVKDAGESYYSDYIRASTILEFLQILSNKLLLFSIIEQKRLTHFCSFERQFLTTEIFINDHLLLT